MKLVIELTDKMHQAVKDGTWCGNELWYNALKNGKPLTEIIESIKDKILDNYDNSKGDGVREECLDIIDNAIYGGRHYADADKGEQE